MSILPRRAEWRRRAVTVFVALALPESLVAQLPSPGAARPVQFSVMDARTDARLPYAVVTISAVGIERFTDSRGLMTLPSLAPGDYDVSVRRLGFVPFRERITLGGERRTFEIRLQRVAQRLAGMSVSASLSCPNPGAPDPARDPEVHMLVSLLRENADRYKLLATQHPFVAMQARALGELRESAAFVQLADVAQMPLSTKSEYRTGGVVRRRGREYTMALPTILELTDDEFVRRHCFSYGGATKETTAAGEETWFRIDVRADDALTSPDVHGAFFLDSATAQLRRMSLELSRPDKLPGALSSVEQVQVSTTFAEIASGLSVIDAVCAVTRTRAVPSKKKDEPPSPAIVPIELQQLVSYLFTPPPPDVAAHRQYESPAWQSGTYVARSAVWCENQPRSARSM